MAQLMKFKNKLLEDFFVPPYAFAIIVMGYFIRKVDQPKIKQLYCTILGVVTYGFCIGNMVDIYATLTMKMINSLVIRMIGPKKCHIYSLGIIFTLVTILRIMIITDLLKISFLADMIILFLILRLVGFAFWVNAESKRRNDENLSVADIVSLYDEMSYYFCYCGMVIGPCISYPTYIDMLHMNQIKNEKNVSVVEYLPSLMDIIREDIMLVIYLASVGILAKSYVDASYLASDQFLYKDSMMKKMWLITVSSIILKYRLYIAFILSKWTCKSLGMGAYPIKCNPKPLIGPSEEALPYWTKVLNSKQISFVTIENINVGDIEFGYIYGNMVRKWNITVQSWLAHYIYAGLSFKRRSVGRFATFIVSALWHGLYPGYYFTFGTAIVLLSLESRMVYYYKTHLSNISSNMSMLLKCAVWFLLHRLIDYAVIGFFLLKAYPTIRLWTSVYFYGHVALFTLTILAYILIPTPKTITHRNTATKEKLK